MRERRMQQSEGALGDATATPSSLGPFSALPESGIYDINKELSYELVFRRHTLKNEVVFDTLVEVKVKSRHVMIITPLI